MLQAPFWWFAALPQDRTPFVWLRGLAAILPFALAALTRVASLGELLAKDPHSGGDLLLPGGREPVLKRQNDLPGGCFGGQWGAFWGAGGKLEAMLGNVRRLLAGSLPSRAVTHSYSHQ
ncbi:hypothetical protein T492DRAFT_1020312 [Pavlovales sp. CCMP2436]|nr:hypothetical protein T492DRAFT_1020312 [Pavlovales sp. CCMP2436]